MKYHKWKDNTDETSLSHKNQTCENCEITRQWLGGCWQVWEYWISPGHTTFIRPKCTDKNK